MKFHKNKRSIIALLGVAALVLLYLAALITAFLDIPNWDKLFQASIVATIGIPILLWVYLLLIKGIKNRQSDAYFSDDEDSGADAKDSGADDKDSDPDPADRT